MDTLKKFIHANNYGQFKLLVNTNKSEDEQYIIIEVNTELSKFYIYDIKNLSADDIFGEDRTFEKLFDVLVNNAYFECISTVPKPLISISEIFEKILSHKFCISISLNNIVNINNHIIKFRHTEHEFRSDPLEIYSIDDINETIHMDYYADLSPAELKNKIYGINNKYNNCAIQLINIYTELYGFSAKEIYENLFKTTAINNLGLF